MALWREVEKLVSARALADHIAHRRGKLKFPVPRESAAFRALERINTDWRNSRPCVVTGKAERLTRAVLLFWFLRLAGKWDDVAHQSVSPFSLVQFSHTAFFSTVKPPKAQSQCDRFGMLSVVRYT
jgi:hypothetical protein